MMKEVALEKRDCDVCGSGNLELLWSYEKKTCANGAHDGFLFKVNDVICRECGFAFVSPRFGEDDLADYYGSSLRSPADQAIDYDISFRMDTINRVNPNKGKGTFVEIGPSTFGEFQEKLGESFSYTGIEPSGEFSSEWKDVQHVDGAGIADIVAHYFVLEHIPDPLKFLIECNRLLKADGIMIVEIPNIEIFPVDPVALYLHEHQSHFSPKALECLAGKAGFVQLEYSADSSRSFGMTAVFKKVHEASHLTITDSVNTPHEYDINKALMERGLANIRTFNDSLVQAKDYIEQSKDESIILWGANQNLVDFLALTYPESDFPDTLHFVDSDPRKRSLLQLYNNSLNTLICTPAESVEKIKQAGSLILFTRRHKGAILRQIAELAGKEFEADRIITVDINP